MWGVELRFSTSNSEDFHILINWKGMNSGHELIEVSGENFGIRIRIADSGKLQILQKLVDSHCGEGNGIIYTR